MERIEMTKFAQVIRKELIRQMNEQGGYFADVPVLAPTGAAIDGVVNYDELIDVIIRFLREDARG